MSDQPKTSYTTLGQFGYFLVAIGVGFVFGCLYMLATGDRTNGNPGAQVPPAHFQKTALDKEGEQVIDLGDGMTLTETIRRSEDGTLKHRFNTINQDGKLVMLLHWSQTNENRAGHTLNSGYWKDGKMLFGESDLDGDGFLEKVYLHDDNGKIKQIFHQTPDGRLFAADPEFLKKTQRAYELVEKTMTPFIEKVQEGVTEEEGRELIRDTVEKAKKDAKQIKKEFPE